MAPEKTSYHSTERTRRGASTSFGSRTDVGCVREQNEDSLIVAPPLFVVADGMGGHAAGEVASEIAVNVIAQNAPEHPDGDELSAAVVEANRSIIDAAATGEGREGMGTTCTAAMLEGERLVIAQVGDSRAYLLHNGQLMQITHDHSLMAVMIEAGQITPEQARVHPNRSVITRALGNDPTTTPDIYEVNVEAGDRLLLCSDGLTGMVFDDDIKTTLKRIKDPQRCASQLVNEAIANGGHDNVTVIVVDVEGTRAKQQKKTMRRTKLTIALILALFIGIIAGVAWGTNQYLSNAAYLADSDGKVAIYQGVPGEFLGFSYSNLIEVSNVEVKDLPVSAQSNIQEGLRCDSVDDARSLVDSYRADIKERSSTTIAGTAKESEDSADSTDATTDGNAGNTGDNSAGAANGDSTTDTTNNADTATGGDAA